MPTYAVWNDALTEYFTYGAPVGSTIYLNVNDRTLALVGEQFWGNAPPEGWAADFVAAVRRAAVWGGRVQLEPLRGVNREGRPWGCAVLPWDARQHFSFEQAVRLLEEAGIPLEDRKRIAEGMKFEGGIQVCQDDLYKVYARLSETEGYTSKDWEALLYKVRLALASRFPEYIREQRQEVEA